MGSNATFGRRTRNTLETRTTSQPQKHTIEGIDNNPKRHPIQLYAGWIGTPPRPLPSNSRTACVLLESKITSLSVHDPRCTKFDIPLFVDCGRNVRTGDQGLCASSREERPCKATFPFQQSCAEWKHRGTIQESSSIFAVNWWLHRRHKHCQSPPRKITKYQTRFEEKVGQFRLAINLRAQCLQQDQFLP
jgi:hypothetical protein